ncbi:unnamed protein product, partial [Discosporangium mesarthrocarpum]
MMIREHTRLLFLYALRANASADQQSVYVRLARKGDISAIQSLNLKTLPENYTPQFYANHIANWPELALVAEHPSEEPGTTSEVVGYVLGRIDGPAPGVKARSSSHGDGQSGLRAVAERMGLGSGGQGAGNSGHGHGQSTRTSGGSGSGHVTSLAVLPEWRRGGIARELMNNLHEKLVTCYNVESVSLHVRQSNKGAIRLYSEVLGYTVTSVAKGYYCDGEDANIMTATLQEHCDLGNAETSGLKAATVPGGKYEKFDEKYDENTPTVAGTGAGAEAGCIGGAGVT